LENSKGTFRVSKIALNHYPRFINFTHQTKIIW
jgi:hypothetical protein